MKRMLLPFLLGTTLVACTKTSNTSSTPTTPPTSTTTTTSDPNKVTVVDNGTTYTASGTYPVASNQTPVMVSIIKSTSSILEVGAGGTGSQFILSFQANGPANALGNYQIVNSNGMTIFTETFSGGQAYAVDSGTVNITTASSTNVTGTYTIHLTGGKTITGSINATKPQVQ